MEKTYNGLPLLDATLDWELGIYCLSLVKYPATEKNWKLFSKQEGMKFAVTNEDEHKVLSVIRLADTPIYRRDELGNEFYIEFPKEVLYESAKRMLANGFQNNTNIEHIESSVVYGFEMVQLFIKDSSKGISPVGFEDVPEGSLFGEFYVADETLLQEIRSGKFSGISLEGEFGLKEKEINSIEELVEYLGLK